jgi:hypothetical protein
MILIFKAVSILFFATVKSVVAMVSVSVAFLPLATMLMDVLLMIVTQLLIDAPMFLILVYNAVSLICAFIQHNAVIKEIVFLLTS